MEYEESPHRGTFPGTRLSIHRLLLRSFLSCDMGFLSPSLTDEYNMSASSSHLVWAFSTNNFEFDMSANRRNIGVLVPVLRNFIINVSTQEFQDWHRHPVGPLRQWPRCNFPHFHRHTDEHLNLQFVMLLATVPTAQDKESLCFPL